MTDLPIPTPLHALHLGLGGRMVPFAGYDLPVNYPAGIIAEHNWTRENAGLFDVSHMGQAFLIGPGAAARVGNPAARRHPGPWRPPHPLQPVHQ